VSDLFFDDFPIGARFETAGLTVTEQAILDFGRRYDQQPYHINLEAAGQSMFGGLIASGIQTIVLSFGLFFGRNLIQASSLASPGMDEIRFHGPLKPGDTIHVTVEVTDAKPSRSKPDRGVIWMRHDTLNQHDAIIMSMTVRHILKRRPDPTP
jgi:acyl dehydratase